MKRKSTPAKNDNSQAEEQGTALKDKHKKPPQWGETPETTVKK